MSIEDKYNNIGGEALKAKTGKDWQGWFQLLDKEKAGKLPHKEIAMLLYEKHKLPGWWAQMVTVGYEQAKGIRVPNQKHDGNFSVDISKVIETDIDNLYNYVEDETLRKKWLKDKVEVRKATPNKTIRANFTEQTANLTFAFYAKGDQKAQVVITETKLKDGDHVEERRKFWKGAITKLESLLSA